MQVGKNTVVSIDYTLTDSAGQVLDTSKGRGPLSYIHGVGGIIPGLERALDGKSAGDALKVAIPPQEAYGPKDPNLIQPVPRRNFQVQQIQVGMQFQAQSQDGMQRVVTVVAVDDANVTIDANHPLAGQTLNFDVTVVDVREATPDELSHGHVHGAGGHDHG